MPHVTEHEYQELFSNNRDWVKEMTKTNPAYFKELAKGQEPKYLYIGCSDSRIPPNQLTGTGPGELFIHRNIANQVLTTDSNFMSVLEYSVRVLKVEHVIVCGHYGCGGVRAAVDGKYHGEIDNWLHGIKDVYRLYYDELEALKDPSDPHDTNRHRRLVEHSVREQVYKVAATTIFQRAVAEGQPLKVHGWVYDLENGLLNDLRVDLESEVDAAPIYKIEFPKGQ